MLDRRRAYQIFADALELEGAALERYLEAECGTDADLRAAVGRYLATAAGDRARTGSLLEAAAPRTESLVGTSLGRFRLIEVIGEGGMGVVYRAERTDGVDQTVAVKVVGSALDPVARQRFRREAQLLARLEHPAIARLVDTGIEDERAWFALEFVRGVPIDRYCEEHGVGPRAIVRLVALLAGAVSAAHALLVVHSDIKPSNVLVLADGSPKLIDFGIGALLAEGSPDLVATSARMYTPHFAAPEQMLGQPVTVATDVFGLGALAYRLLCGRPLHGETDAAGYLRALASPPGAPALGGDLDAIVLKALEREPARRYASAAEMAADLGRYLEHRPVAARAQTPAYRAGRFVRRNALAVSFSALLVASLAAGAIVAAIQARRATVARDEARAVTAFLTNDILAAANPMVSGTRDVELRPLLDHAAGTLETRFVAQPRVLAELQAALGTGYAALFDADKAEALLNAAERGLAREYGDAAAETQAARLTLWYLYLGRIDLPRLGQVSARMNAAEVAAGRPESANALRGRLMVDLIPCFLRSPVPIGWSDCGPTVAAFHDAARARFGDAAVPTDEMGWLTGVALVYASREDEAVPLLRAACAGMERTYGPIHHRLTACRRFLAWALDGSGHPEEAEPLFEQAIHNFATTLGPESIFAAISQYEYAAAALHAGHVAEALAAARAAVQALAGPGCDCADDLARARMRLALIEVAAGDLEAGLALAREDFRVAVAAAASGAPGLIALRSVYAQVLLAAGAAEEARAVAEENLAAVRAVAGRPAWLEPECQAELAYVLAGSHRPAEARALLDTATPALERLLGAANARTRRAVAARAQNQH